MNQFVMALMAAMLFLSACASTGGTASSGGGLPEIAPYDEPTYEPLPDMVPAA